MCELAAVLAAHDGSGYVVAPAGYGKTHLIAEAAARSSGRQLVLTHTYAGVNALRHKMRSLGVSDKFYRIDTIASWAIRLSLSYSTTSDWNIERPDDNEQWSALYQACARLLDHEFARRIVRASYGGLYVDEYQDCSIAQHNIVLKLARDIPTRVLGDPLQGIFDFAGQDPVDWPRDVENSFECLGSLDCQRRRDYAPERRSKSAPRASAVACPRSPREGPARGTARPPRGWRRPARGRGLWAHGDKRGYWEGVRRRDWLCLSL